MENHLDFIVIKAEPKFCADSFALDEADCSAAPVETGIVPVTLSLYACDKRDTAARRAWDNFGVVTEMVPLGLLSGFLLLSQAYEDADVLIDDCLYLDQPLGEMVDQLTAHGYDCENTFIINDVPLTPAAHNQDVLDAVVTRLPATLSHASRLSAGACLSAGGSRRPADAACRKQWKMAERSARSGVLVG